MARLGTTPRSHVCMLLGHVHDSTTCVSRCCCVVVAWSRQGCSGASPTRESPKTLRGGGGVVGAMPRCQKQVAVGAGPSAITLWVEIGTGRGLLALALP